MLEVETVRFLHRNIGCRLRLLVVAISGWPVGLSAVDASVMCKEFAGCQLGSRLMVGLTVWLWFKIPSCPHLEDEEGVLMLNRPRTTRAVRSP